MSTEVYGKIKEVLGPWCKANGFKRTRSMLGWFKPYENRFLVFWFQCSQDGWDQFAGSKFIVEFQLDSISEPGGAGDRHRLPFFLDQNQLEQVRQLQNEVISHLKKPSPDYFILNMDQRTRDWYLAKFNLVSDAPTNQSDLWLRYHGVEDIRRWTLFVQQALPGILGRLAPGLKLVSLE